MILISQSKNNGLFSIIKIYIYHVLHPIFSIQQPPHVKVDGSGVAATAVGGNFDGGRTPDDWKLETY